MHHSTEIALVKMTNDLFLALEKVLLCFCIADWNITSKLKDPASVSPIYQINPRKPGSSRKSENLHFNAQLYLAIKLDICQVCLKDIKLGLPAAS